MSEISSPTKISWGTRDLCYCPPEYIREVLFFHDTNRQEYGTSELVADATFDVWSFGCILYYLTSGRPLFTVSYPTQGYLKGISNWSTITNEHLSYVMIDVRGACCFLRCTSQLLLRLILHSMWWLEHSQLPRVLISGSGTRRRLALYRRAAHNYLSDGDDSILAFATLG